MRPRNSNRQTPTPNDATASNVCRSALCAPSRAALLTGTMVSRNGRRDQTAQTELIDVHQGIASLKRGVPTLASRLRDAGFATGMFGKWHLHRFSTRSQAHACDVGSKRHWNASEYAEVHDAVHDAGFTTVAALYPCNLPEDAAHSHNAEWIVERACQFIEDAMQSPRRFFAYVSLTLPHSPHPWSALQLPLDRTPMGGEAGWPCARAVRRRRAAREWVQRTLEATFGLQDVSNPAQAGRTARSTGVLWLDRSVGDLLDSLEAAGASQSTLVMFVSDHGRDGKWTCNGPGVLVPLVVRWPAAIAPGTLVTEHIVSTLDLLPTIMEAASIPSRRARRHDSSAGGVEPAPDIGRSALRILTGSGSSVRSYALCETYLDRGVTGTTHALVWRQADSARLVGRPSRRAGVESASHVLAGRPARLPRAWQDDLQLYDLRADPQQRTNVVNASGDGLSAIKLSLFKVLQAHTLTLSDSATSNSRGIFRSQYTVEK